MSALIWDVLVGGIEFKTTSMGGEECRDHISAAGRICIVAMGLVLSCIGIYFGREVIYRENPRFKNAKMSSTRLTLLTVLTLLFGMQLGFKFATKSVIYLLFPCKAVTMIWIWLLGSKRPNYLVFRCMMNLTHGALLGLLFPVTDGLAMPGEYSAYWLHHWLLFLLPFYCVVFEKDAFYLPSDKFFDWPYVLFTFGAFGIYHFGVMQAASWVTLVNIGHQLCPAPSDPFANFYPSYMIIGTVHQFACILISSLMSSAAVKTAKLIRGKDGEDCDVGGEKCNGISVSNGSVSHSKKEL